MLRVRNPLALLAALALALPACSSDVSGSTDGGSADAGGSPQFDGSIAQGGGGGGGGDTRDGAAGAGQDAAGAVGDGGGDVVIGRSWYVDPATGRDDQDGSLTRPFQTIARAASGAQAGDVVFLLDGTYAAPVEAGLAAKAKAGEITCAPTSGVHIPAGVGVRAVNRGKAKIVVSGSYGLCLDGGASLKGLALQLPAADAVGVEAKAGVVTVVETTVGMTEGSGLNVMGFSFTGTAQATILPGALASYSVLPASKFARVLGSAELAIQGGTIEQSMLAVNGMLDVQGGGSSRSTA